MKTLYFLIFSILICSAGTISGQTTAKPAPNTGKIKLESRSISTTEENLADLLEAAASMDKAFPDTECEVQLAGSVMVKSTKFEISVKSKGTNCTEAAKNAQKGLEECKLAVKEKLKE